jgi:tetratricopeptide (TPR) repeat protein
VIQRPNRPPALPTEAPAASRSLLHLGFAYLWAARADQEREHGCFRSSERFARQALVLAGRLGPNAAHLRARLWNAVGMACKYRGRFSAAARAYARASHELGARGSRDRLADAALWHNRGGLEHARGRFARAEVLARRGLALRQEALGPGHMEVARDLAALGAILDGQLRHHEAESRYRRALEIYRGRWRVPRRDIAATLGNLAACLHLQGRRAEAERTGSRAVALCARELGREHPETRLAEANLQVIRSSAAGPLSGPRGAAFAQSQPAV